jgi:hypothetical protein
LDHFHSIANSEGLEPGRFARLRSDTFGPLKKDPEASEILNQVLRKLSETAIERAEGQTASRRKWSLDDKIRIIAETTWKHESVTKVAKKYNLNPGQIFVGVVTLEKRQQHLSLQLACRSS